jgi:proteasome accessory factor A
VQTFLKLGSAALLLDALEDGALPEPLLLADPVTSVWAVSHDMSLSEVIELDDGRTMTAIEAQWQYLEWAKKYLNSSDLGEVYGRLVQVWEDVLTDLESDPLRLADRLDWVAKYRLLLGYRDRDGLEWTDPKLRLLDLQYHDVDPERGLHRRLVAAGEMRRLFTDDEVSTAAGTPPENTRAYFRGECVARFGDALVAANWDSLVFDTGEETLKRVPMMEPLRGSKEMVGDLLDRCDTPAALMRALGGDDG